jgi:vacuolar protein 8
VLRHWVTYLQKVGWLPDETDYRKTDGTLVGDYSIFVQDWKEPNGGIHGYLSRFLQSGDATFQHIAIWTLLQLLESEDKSLINLIGKSEQIVTQIKEIANRQIEPDNEFEDDDEGEVVNLAQRCLELLGQSMSKTHIEG